MSNDEQTALRFVCGVFDRWIIVRADAPYLAWSGSRWVPHASGIGTGGVQVSNFATEDEARAHARSIDAT